MTAGSDPDCRNNSGGIRTPAGGRPAALRHPTYFGSRLDATASSRLLPRLRLPRGRCHMRHPAGSYRWLAIAIITSITAAGCVISRGVSVEQLPYSGSDVATVRSPEAGTSAHVRMKANRGGAVGGKQAGPRIPMSLPRPQRFAHVRQASKTNLHAQVNTAPITARRPASPAPASTLHRRAPVARGS